MEEEEEEIVINKDYYEGIKSMITCSICSLIIQNPVQCNKCQNFFCSKCINNWTIKSNFCPFKCQDNEYIPSRICKNLISQIKVKCKCGEEMSYDKYVEHKDICNNYMNKKYLLLKEKYDKLLIKAEKYDMLMEKINKEEKENKEFTGYAYILFPSHKHKLKIMRRFVNSWFCSECKSSFQIDDPSYHCTLCDYDICLFCSLEIKPIKGQIHKEMIEYYKKKYPYLMK